MIALLADLEVIDLSTTAAGATAARLFAEIGARVTRVELRGSEAPPPQASLTAETRAVVNRTKASVSVDLDRAGSRDVIEHLVKQADVLVEDLATRQRARIGLDCDDHRRLQPGLIHVAIRWWPVDTGVSELPPYQELLQAYLGTMRADSAADAPEPIEIVRVGEPTASLLGAIGGLAALLRRDDSGAGACVTTSVLQGALQQQTTSVVYAERDRSAQPRRAAQRSLGGFGPFECADGDWVFVSGWTDRQFQEVSRAAGVDHLAGDPAYGSRVLRTESGDAINTILAHWVSGLQSDELISTLRAARVPVARVAESPAQLISDEHAVETGMLAEIADPELGPTWQVATTFEADGAPPTIGPSRPLGADTTAVLLRFGLSDEAIEALLDRGVVGPLPRSEA